MKAFISSTFTDLIAYRKAVAESIERLGHQAEKMEVFGARPEGAQEVCQKEIKNCDLFIGIYAYRYGFIPSQSQTSITEQEFDYARELRKPIFCFLIDEDHPWPFKLIEPEPGYSKLNAFKNRIRNSYVIDTYTTPEDLAFKVSTSISKYLSENATIAKDAATNNVPGQALVRPVKEVIEIKTSTQYVWDALINPKLFTDWVSFIHKCEGSIGPEGVLVFRSWPFRIQSKLKIVEVEEGRELYWIRYFPLVKEGDLSVKYLFRLESLDTSNTSLLQEEKLEGNLADLVWVLSLFGVIPHFTARTMNNKLKKLAERGSRI